MIGPARVCTIIVVHAAVCDALGAPFGADVVWDGLSVLRDVRGHVVLADAGVDEGVCVAVVGHGGHRRHARLLETDERALGLLVVTPCLCSMLGSEGRWRGKNLRLRLSGTLSGSMV